MGKGGGTPPEPPKAVAPTKVVQVKAPQQMVVNRQKKPKKGFGDTVLSESQGLGAPAAPKGGSAGGSTVLGNAGGAP